MGERKPNLREFEIFKEARVKFPIPGHLVCIKFLPLGWLNLFLSEKQWSICVLLTHQEGFINCHLGLLTNLFTLISEKYQTCPKTKSSCKYLPCKSKWRHSIRGHQHTWIIFWEYTCGKSICRGFAPWHLSSHKWCKMPVKFEDQSKTINSKSFKADKQAYYWKNKENSGVKEEAFSYFR